MILYICCVQRRFQMHEKAVQSFLDYFKFRERIVTVDVSSGASEAIWDKVHEVFTSLHLKAWRPVDSVLVFAMGKSCYRSVGRYFTYGYSAFGHSVLRGMPLGKSTFPGVDSAAVNT